MTTIKTSSPEKFKSSIKFIPTNEGIKEIQVTAGDVATKVNQLIDYLAELTEVVERQEAQITNLRGGWTDVEINKTSLKQWPQLGDTIYRLNSAGNIIEQPWYASEKQMKCRSFVGIFKSREEAQATREAIINRLIP